MATNWVVNGRDGRVVGVFSTKRAALALLRSYPGGFIEKVHDGNIVRI